MVYENIKNICEKKSISISALEEKAGLGNGTIGKWKSGGASPTINSLCAVANVLEVEVTRLLKGESNGKGRH